MYLRAFTASLALSCSTAALAGEQVLYEDAPDWVEIAQLDASDKSDNSAILLIDEQSRISDGRLTTYVDSAVALDTPQALTQFGTFSANWMPDKGDLIVHKVQLIRDGEEIDLLAQGAEFEVLRREQGLESRLLSGALTATMTIPGARLGDVVRVSYSTTLKDQAMGDNSQWQGNLIAKPFPLVSGRVKVSWPRDMEVSRVRLGENYVPEPVLDGDYYVWSVALPVNERDPKPGDAPSRFQLGDLLQVSTYRSWEDVSSSMAAHYDPAGTINPQGEIAAEVTRIAAQSDDPLERAALALQLVQDDISYLLNGLNGGNYLPQSPEETWENRFGDCKAKSMLLHAMLQELGIQSELTLVSTVGGDALPMLAPMPGNFDHIIVKAVIDGQNYWLDGTSSGSRIDTIGNVPRFHYALPLREEGAGLMALDTRPNATPDQIVRLDIDQSAGLNVPGLFDIAFEFRDVTGAQWRAAAEQGNEEYLENAVHGLVYGTIGESYTIDHRVSYNEETGVARISANGILTSQWTRDEAEHTLTPPSQAARNVYFNADRARADWRDIPLNLSGPLHHRSEVAIRLPQSDASFEVDGEAQLREMIGGVELSSQADLQGNEFRLTQSMRSVLEELPADQISQARRGLNRFSRALPDLRASGEVRELWDYLGDDKAALAPIEARFARIIAHADDDDASALIGRAQFRSSVYDFEGALEDIKAAHAIESSIGTYWMLANLQRETGDLEAALENLKLAEDLQPDGSTYSAQIELLAMLERSDEALDLAEDFAEITDDRTDKAEMMSTALGWAGSYDEGLEVLERLKARRPGDGSLLNSICWYTGIWNRMDAGHLESCVAAVEKSDYSAAALDSRALAYYRMGDLDAAMADIDAALLVAPSQAPSRLLRGIIRMAQGDRAGRDEIELALQMQPSLRTMYEAWGLEF